MTGTSSAHTTGWSLGIRDRAFDVLVLLCRQHLDVPLDFVVPRNVLGDISKWVDPHEKRRLKFKIRKTKQGFVLKNTDSTMIVPVSSYLREYGPLRDDRGIN